MGCGYQFECCLPGEYLVTIQPAVYSFDLHWLEYVEAFGDLINGLHPAASTWKIILTSRPARRYNKGTCKCPSCKAYDL